MRARVLRSRGEDLAGAADVDEAQPGQLEVNVTRSAAEFLAERVAKRGTAVMSASPARSSPPLSRDRADAERFALDGGRVWSVLPTSDHGRPPAPVIFPENRSYYDMMVGGGRDGNVPATRKGLVGYGHHRRG